MSPKGRLASPDPAVCRCERIEGVLRLCFAGDWRMRRALPDPAAAFSAMAAAPRPSGLAFDCSALVQWDSVFLTFCRTILARARAEGLAVDPSGLPPGAVRLLELADKVPERPGAAQKTASEPFLARIGSLAFSVFEGAANLLEFVGETSRACSRLAVGRAVFRGSDLAGLVRQCGLEALPIVSLISLLVGLILAFVGAIQLRQFGAQIYVSTIVGIAMVRVMGAIMTGIIMAGRTGAAFAAELGAMQVNEETDALRTMGFSPVEFLVLPRMLALTLMLPLLCVYADLMGVLGGFLVGTLMLQITPMQYLTHTWQSVPLANFWIGLTHSTVFGVLVALAGCYQGMRCGRSATAVGRATTAAVVAGILSIIIATAILTMLCEVIGV